jgi:hypothetical protein
VTDTDDKCEKCSAPGVGFNDDGEFLCEDCLFEHACDALTTDPSDNGDCPTCGGDGFIDGDCTCMDDTCCCLDPDPPPCPDCG